MVNSVQLSGALAAGNPSPAPAAAAGEARLAVRADAPAQAAPPPAQAVSAELQQQFADGGREAVEAAVAQIQRFLKLSPAALEFSVDGSSGRVLLRITDSQTKELIRQVPSDEVLAIARALDRFQGLFVSQTA